MRQQKHRLVESLPFDAEIMWGKIGNGHITTQIINIYKWRKYCIPWKKKTRHEIQWNRANRLKTKALISSIYVFPIEVGTGSWHGFNVILRNNNSVIVWETRHEPLHAKESVQLKKLSNIWGARLWQSVIGQRTFESRVCWFSDIGMHLLW